jgi:hypothetical protein
MAIFQKIAASSFAAVRRTLKRRMLMLTLHEALLRDRELDIEGRERLYEEARDLIHAEWNFGRDTIGRSEVDQVIADLKYSLAKKFDEEALEMASDPYGTEYASSHIEDLASAVVNLHLPEERRRIGDLLAVFPQQRETKVQKLLDGLGTLWRQNPSEKIVIFATYLGTVDLLAREIEQVYPGQGVVVLRGATTARRSRPNGASVRRTARAFWFARPPDVRASIFNLPVFCSILISRGTRWTWSSGSAASTDMDRRTPPRSIIWSCLTRSKAASSCCLMTS